VTRRVFGVLLCFGLAGCGGRGPTESASAPIAYRDATQALGISFTHHNGAFGEKYLPEIMGSGVAVFDYDRDGWLDLYFVDGGRVPGAAQGDPRHGVLFHNDAGTHFTDVTDALGLTATLYGMGAVVGDVNNDGFPDLYLTAVGGDRFYLNEGGTRFRDATKAFGLGNDEWSCPAAFFDYDKDGWLDLVVGNYVHWLSPADHVKCEVIPGQRSYCGPDHHQPTRVLLYRNLGGERFEDRSAAAGIAGHRAKALGIVVVDADRDGDPDIFVACDKVANLYFVNRGDGTFDERALEAGLAVSPEGMPRAGMGVAVSDFHRNGNLAIAITNFSNEGMAFFTQDDAGHFTDRAAAAGLLPLTLDYLGFGALFTDANLDGWPDLVAVNGHIFDDVDQLFPGMTFAQRTLLFRNRRTGAFNEVGAASGEFFGRPIVGRGLAAGDLNNDGRPDLVVTANNGPAIVLLNETPPAHWLLVQCIGGKSNRAGYGARIVATVGDLTLREEVTGSGSYLSHSDDRVLLGLGRATRVDRLEVTWPSGQVDTYENVAADRLVIVREGSGTLEERAPGASWAP